MSVMDRRKFVKASGGIAGVGLFAGCIGSLGGGGNQSGSGGQNGTSGSGQNESGGGGGGSGERITIGALEPLSGNFTPWGQDHRAGLEFGIREINQNGGVLGGRQLRAVVEDTGSNPGNADSIFRRFVEQENAVAVTGPVSSDVGIRTARTAEDLETPLYLHMSGSNEVITPETTHTFRVGLLPAATMMQAQTQLVESEGYQRVGAIVGDYAWGQSVKSSIEENFPVDVNIQVAPLDASDFKSYLRQFDQNIEFLVVSGHPPGSLTIAGQAYQLGLNPETISGAGIPPRVIFEALGQDITNGFTHVHNSDVYSEEYAEVGTRFAEATGNRFGSHVSYGYVTAQLIAAAIEDAGEANPTAIRDATRSINFDTLFAKPIQYTEHGELKDTVELYSQFALKAPSFYSKGKWRLTELFRTDPLPALPADQ
jgi:branched-chain amino acid transport system substrate-binding protein